MSPKKPQQRFNAYMQYSGIGFQMMGAILICAWLGRWLDEYFSMSKPLITVVGMLFGVSASIFLMIRSVQRLQKKEEKKKDK